MLINAYEVDTPLESVKDSLDSTLRALISHAGRLEPGVVEACRELQGRLGSGGIRMFELALLNWRLVEPGDALALMFCLNRVLDFWLWGLRRD